MRLSDNQAVRIALVSLAILIGGCRSTSIDGRSTQELVQRTKEFNQAFSLRDTATLQSLMAPDYMFHYVDRSVVGTIRPIPNAPRGNWPDELFAKLSNGPLEWSLVDARIVGGVGIVVSHYRWQGAFAGASFNFEGYMTDIWIRRRGEWRILFSTADVLPPPS